MNFDFIALNIENSIAHISLNRPEKANALHAPFWQSIKNVFDYVDASSDVKVVVLSGQGRNFCAGIDFSMLKELMSNTSSCPGEFKENFYLEIKKMQDSFNAIEACKKPVLAAIDGACVGAGVDLISACDMRYCTEAAFFNVKEVDLGITADLGTLQRLPHIVGLGIAKEWALTARDIKAQEAKECFLVNRVFSDQSGLLKEVLQIAELIRDKSALAVRGTKKILNYSRDHSVMESLDYVATWNAAVLPSKYLQDAVMGRLGKK